MCAVTGTSRADGDDGGSTSSLISEIAFFGVPAQLLLISPDTLPARSTLLSGSRALETAVASGPICRRGNRRLSAPFCAGDLFLARALQFFCCKSPLGLPPPTP